MYDKEELVQEKKKGIKQTEEHRDKINSKDLMMKINNSNSNLVSSILRILRLEIQVELLMHKDWED